MAKDPAFLFYDGDAARDVSHMNRLERGCYFDFIQAQKKFGPMNLVAIKKILGKDFDECWAALNLVLTYEEDMYFIAWLKDSIEKRRKFSESRSENRKGKKQAENKGEGSTYVEHMVIENANENENVIVFGNKKEYSISVRTVYANEKPQLIYDLHAYFKFHGKIREFDKAGFNRYEEFMEANPANSFKDDAHLYNAFRRFNLTKQLEHTGKKPSKKEVDEWKQEV